jgi:diguanylate cyclase (GGDEF)-like protein
VAQAWRDTDGLVWALGLDLRALEIDRLVRELPRSAQGEVLLSDRNGQVLGLSFAPLRVLETDTGPRLLRVGEVEPLSVRAQLLDEARALQRVHLIDMEGQRWLAQKRSVHLGDQELSLWQAAPWRDFVPGLQQWLLALLLLALLAALGAAWMAQRSARKLAQPLEYLAQAAQQVGQLQLDDKLRTHWSVAELRTLALAMNDSRRRLRIFHRRLLKREAQLAREVQALTAAEQRLLHVGLHDPLTDLPNRRLLLERLQHALARAQRQAAQTAVLYVDLDRFKEVNDEQGHESGDALLLQTAARLQAVVRSGDTVARLGGDEFVLLLEDVTPQTAYERALAVLATLEQPFVLPAGVSVQVSASVGLCLAPRDGHEAATLLRHADAAMYRAKADGCARVVVYEAGISQISQETRELRHALAEAIAQRQLELWWQPQIDLTSGSVQAAEGLLRWHHPQRGWVPPAVFIPLAEESGLMRALGLLVLEQALEHGARLDAAGWRLRRLAINVSALQLQDDDFVDQVAQRLGAQGWSARRLELEITESVLIDSELAQARLQRMEALGVRLALDDFGTGYASLSYLRRLPFDVLKIDASFVRDIGSSAAADALIGSLIQLGQALELELVAEGVETAAQRRYLEAQGVRWAQGYLWSPARPLADWLGGLAGLQGLHAAPAPAPERAAGAGAASQRAGRAGA